MSTPSTTTSAARDRAGRIVTAFTAAAAVGSGVATLVLAGNLAAASPPPTGPLPGPSADEATRPEGPQLSPPAVAPTAGSDGEPVAGTSAS